MSVYFRSREPDVTVGIGEYQEFPEPPSGDAAPETTAKPELRHFSVVLLSFGLLCVIQAILNVSLRLLAEPSCQDETELEADSCPQGWLMFGSSCYFISTQRRSWDASRQDCVQRGADLVIITSRLEQAFLTGFTKAAWVGMTDRKQEGTWVWVDGTPVNNARLQWALGQPDGAFGGEDCGDLRTMSKFIGLNDFNCSARSQWICEKTLW